MAEGVFSHLVDQSGLQDKVYIESAGTAAYHVGELPDPRTLSTLQQHGIELNSRARQAIAEDFLRFDYILAMDLENLRNLERIAPRDGHARLELFGAYAERPEFQGSEVPDPYYGGKSGFETVFEMVKDAGAGLMKQVSTEINSSRG